jgi:cobalt-zinc-cadmium resistance protein CzcA
LPLAEKALPPGIKLRVIHDQSDLVHKAVSTVTKALLESFVLIIIVLIAFLMNARAAFLVLLSVPISIVAALIAMALLGISANLMSLGGLAIAIGMMVDGSVVMMENIFARLTGHATIDWRERIEQAAREVAKPVFFCGADHHHRLCAVVQS